jgi:hypothetical protein
MNFEGEATPYGEVDIGAEVTMGSFAHHVWRFDDAESGEVICYMDPPES